MRQHGDWLVRRRRYDAYDIGDDDGCFDDGSIGTQKNKRIKNKEV